MEDSRSIEIYLCEFWGIEELQFTAQFAINKNGIGYFRNVRLEDGTRCIYPDQSQVTISVSPELNYDENYDYRVNAYVAPIARRKQLKREFVLLLDKRRPPRILEIEPKEYINKLRYEYTSAKGIAKDSLIGSLKRLSSETNKKPETFIFELIQNADDNYDLIKKKVNVRFMLTESHMILVHNGQPFNQKNVYGICGVASGDKEYEFNKTGYKGIGFKSVFKHSNYVWIHSGGYSFRFDEMYHKGKGYETFWQVLPIWTDEEDVAKELRTPQILQAPVSFVFRPYDGKKRLIEIENIFRSVFEDEKVLLFLRSVESISFSGFEHSFTKQKLPKNWEISSLPLVKVSESIREELNEIVEKKLDERVPEKFKDIHETDIKFATRKVENKISTTEDGKVYAYLPTSLHFGFPFLINGDFIPDGSRDKLFWDIEWNRFLFEQAGYQFVCWIKALYEQHIDSGIFDLIPNFDELILNETDSDKKAFLNLFHEGFLAGINDVPIFPGIDHVLHLPDGLLVDKTGLSEYFPEEFSKLTGFNAPLIHPLLNDIVAVKHILEAQGTVFNKKGLMQLCDEEDFQSWLEDVENNKSFLRYLGSKNWLDEFSDKRILLSANNELKIPNSLYDSLSEDCEYIDWIQVDTVHPDVYKACRHLELPVIVYEAVSFIKEYIKKNAAAIYALIEDKANNLKFYRYIFKHRALLTDDLFTNNYIGYFQVWGQDEDAIGSLSNDTIYLYDDVLVGLKSAGIFPDNHINILSSEFPEAHDDVQLWADFWKRFGVNDPSANNYFDFLKDEILEKIGDVNTHFKSFEPFEEGEVPSDDYEIKTKANLMLWEFIHKLIGKLSQEQLGELKSKLGRLVVFNTTAGETEYAEGCYLSKDYTDNGTLETLVAAFDEINLSFISDLYLRQGNLTKTAWRDLFTKYASVKTDEKEFAEVVLKEINDIAEDNLVEALKFIYKYKGILTDETDLSRIPIKTEAGEFVEASKAIIGDHYISTSYFGTILPSIEIENLVSSEYCDNRSEGWVNFFKEIGLDHYSDEKDVINLKIDWMLDEALVTTDNAVEIVNELARLNREDKLDEGLIEKLKELPLLIKGQENEMEQAVNCRLPSVYGPRVDLEKLVENCEDITFVSEVYLNEFDLRLDVIRFLSKIVTGSFTLISKKDYPWSEVPEDYRGFIAKNNISTDLIRFNSWTELVDVGIMEGNPALLDVFWSLSFNQKEWLYAYHQKGLIFAKNKIAYRSREIEVFNYTDYLLSIKANTPTISGVYKPAFELYAYELRNLIEDKEFVCKKELSEIIVLETQKKLEEILGVKQELSLSLCLKRINKLKDWIKLEKEGVWNRVFELLDENAAKLDDDDQNALEDFKENGYLPNQLGDWVLASDLYFIADGFKLGVGKSMWLVKNALSKYAEKFGATALTEDDFQPEYKDKSIETDLNAALEKRLKYIAFAEDQLNYEELEEELRGNLSGNEFSRVSRIAYTYAEVDPPIANVEFNFYHSGQHVYYVGQWNGARASRLIDFIHKTSESKISIKLFQDMLLNEEAEIIDYFDEKNLGVPDDWRPRKPEASVRETSIAETRSSPSVVMQETPSIDEEKLIRHKSDSVGLPADKRKQVNIEAKKVARIWLENNGFELEQAEETFDQINNVYQPESECFIKVLVSSISGGILYFRPVKWIDLGTENTFLLTVDGAGNTRRYETQDELLQAHKRTLFRFTNQMVDSDMIDQIAEVNAEVSEAQFLFYDAVSHFDEHFSMTTATRLKPGHEIIDISPGELGEIDLNQ